MRSAVFMMLSWLAASAAAADTPCSLKRLASDNMLITEDGLMIGATVGTQKLPFILDTRLVRSVMFEQTVQQLGLPLTRGLDAYVDIDSHPLLESTQVPLMQLGALGFSATPFLVAHKTLASDGHDIAGLLGAEFLRYYDVEIDPAGGKLNLYAQDHCPGKVVYWANQYFASPIHLRGNLQVEIDVELDGQPLQAVLSTGLADSLLQMRVASNRFGLDDHSPGMTPAGSISDLSGYPISTYRYAFKKLKFGEITINNPEIKVAENGTFSTVHTHLDPNHTADLLIGMNFLKKLRLYIAYQEDKLYYTVGP